MPTLTWLKEQSDPWHCQFLKEQQQLEISGEGLEICHFSGWWAELQRPLWPVAFSSFHGHKAVFKQGPWENWPQSLPSADTFDASLPLVFSPYCATWFHEILGHALEDDFLRHGTFHQQQGNRLTHQPLTVSDHPECLYLPGSMIHDSLGRPVSETQLIHRGCLVGDLDAQKGVFRRSHYAEKDWIRGSNLVIEAGKGSLNHWLRTLPSFYLVTGVTRGRWIPGSTKVQCLCGPTALVHRGEPVSAFATLTLEVEHRTFFSALLEIGEETVLDPLPHWCHKHGQSVPMAFLSPWFLTDNVFRNIY
jgi:predicted Zn-dependent protease